METFSARTLPMSLFGSCAANRPPAFLQYCCQRAAPRYDWRELQRWKISEKLLPPGSTVLFREPTVWERYRAWIIAGLSIFILQATAYHRFAG